MDRSCLHPIATTLDSYDVTIDEPLDIIRDMILTLKAEIGNNENDGNEEKQHASRYLDTLTAWTAAYASLLDSELVPEGEEVDGI